MENYIWPHIDPLQMTPYVTFDFWPPLTFCFFSENTYFLCQNRMSKVPSDQKVNTLTPVRPSRKELSEVKLGFINFSVNTYFLCQESDVKGTFRSKKSICWPLYDLHVRSYRRSKLGFINNSSYEGLTGLQFWFLDSAWKLHLTPYRSTPDDPVCDFWLLTSIDLLLFFCKYIFFMPELDVKGTFRSKKSIRWQLYDLHVRSYRRSKLGFINFSVNTYFYARIGCQRYLPIKKVNMWPLYDLHVRSYREVKTWLY